MTVSQHGMELRRTAIRHRRLALLTILNLVYWMVLFVALTERGNGPGINRGSLYDRMGDFVGLISPICWLGSAYLINRLVCEILPRRSWKSFIVATVGCMPMVQIVPAIYVCYVMNTYWQKLDIESSWWRPARRHLKWLEQEGGCFGCGYNMEGNESGICPECGATVGKHS